MTSIFGECWRARAPSIFSTIFRIVVWIDSFVRSQPVYCHFPFLFITPMSCALYLFTSLRIRYSALYNRFKQAIQIDWEILLRMLSWEDSYSAYME